MMNKDASTNKRRKIWIGAKLIKGTATLEAD
jgi:hypothetical protein